VSRRRRAWEWLACLLGCHEWKEWARGTPVYESAVDQVQLRQPWSGARPWSVRTCQRCYKVQVLWRGLTGQEWRNI